MVRYPKQLLALIAQLQKLPGVGRKTAERYAFHLIKWERGDLASFASILGPLKERVPQCGECGCLDI